MARLKSRTTKQSRNQKPFTYTRLEQLEPRLLLSTTLDLAAATPAPNNITFTDNNGDIVTVQLQGTAGQAVITSNDVTTNVVNGSQITGIAITGASSDFVMKFSVDSTTNIGTSDGVVALGNITSDRLIGGLLHVADTTFGSPTSNFELTSFTGPGLSAGGVLDVDMINGNLAGDALVLTQGLGAGQVVDVRSDLTGNVTLGGRTGMGGTINVGADVLAGTWTIAGGVLNSGMVGIRGVDWATTTISGAFAGVATIGEVATGTWTINSISAGGILQALQWNNISVAGDVSGTVAAVTNGGLVGTGLVMDVGGSLQSTARVSSDTDMSLAVARNAVAGSIVHVGNKLVGTVGGTFSSKYVASDDMTLGVTGSMSGGMALSGSNMVLTVGGAITGTKIASSTGVSLTVAGSITNATLFSGETDAMSLDVGGSIVGTTIEAGYGLTATVDGAVMSSTIDGGSQNTSLAIAGDVRDSLFTDAGSLLSAHVGGNVTNTRFAAFGNRISLTVAGSMSGSRVEAYSYISVDVTGNLTGSVLFNANNDLSLHVHGNLVDTTVTSATQDVSADIDGYMLRSKVTSGSSEVTLTVGGFMQDSTVLAATGATVDVSGNLTNSSLLTAADDLSVAVGGNVTGSRFVSPSSDVTVDVAGNMLQSSILGDDITVDVGGNFSGSIMGEGGSIALTVGGAVMAGSSVMTSSSLIASVGSLAGNIQADRLDLVVTGNVAATTTILADQVVDLNADNVAFNVGGSLGGRIDVAGNFNTGTGAAATVVGGSVLAGTKINVAGNLGGAGSAALLNFGAMLGELDVGLAIDSDLHFGGNVTQLSVGGAVMSDITATGRVAFLTSASLYAPVTATTGNFVDGAGTTTGTLTAGSLGIVGPQRTVAPPAAAPFSILDLSAATPAPASATFTDGDGDVITIWLTGTTGSVTFVSNETTVNGMVDNGENLVSATITGASTDFSMTFSVDSSGGGATGVVRLGDITSDRAIRGIYTVVDTTSGPASLFELGSFSAPGFTTSGGLSVDQIDGNILGSALSLTQGVAAGQTVFVAGTLTGNVSLGRWGLAGTMDVNGAVGAGTWALGPVVNTGFLGLMGNTVATMTAGSFAGLAEIAGTDTGTTTLASLTGTGRVQAGKFSDLRVTGNVDGTVQTHSAAATNGISLNVGGSMTATSRLLSYGNLTLAVTGNIASGALVQGYSDVTLSVGGSLMGTAVAYSDMSAAITGNMTGGTLVGGSDITAVIGGSVTNSTLTASSGGTVDIAGQMTGSLLCSTKSHELTLDVGGNVASSTVVVGEYGLEATVGGNVTNSIFELGDHPSTLDISGNVTGTRIDSYQSIRDSHVGGSVTNSTVSSYFRDLTLTIDGQVTGSNLESGASSDYDLTVAGGVTSSRLFVHDSFSIGGSLTNSRVVSGGNAYSAHVGGNVTSSSLYNSYSDITLDVGGQVASANVFAWTDITADVTGNVAGTTFFDNDGSMTLNLDRDVTSTDAICTSDSVDAAIAGGVQQSSILARANSTVNIGKDLTGNVMVNNADLRLATGVFGPGSVLAGSTVMSDRILVARVAGNLAVAVMADQADLTVTGNVAGTGGLMAHSVFDANDDNVGFFVGGTFAGRMNVSNTFNTGTGATATLMGGAVQTGAKLNIVGLVGGAAPLGSATQYVFQGAILGEFDMLGDLGINLLAIGPVAQVSIGGSVKAGILSGGKITALTTGSSFQATSATGGTFRDGFGTATGTLTAASFGTVRPRV